MNAYLPVVALPLCLLARSAAHAGAADDAPRADADALCGTWTCVSAVVDGKPLAEAVVKELRLTIDPRRYKTERGGEVLFDSTYRIDAAKQPHQIEMTATEGDAAGQPALGVYLLDGDTLRLCYVMPGGARPKTFESPPGSKAFLVTWKRAADVSKKPGNGETPGGSNRPRDAGDAK